jgi:hypothetical protein
MKQLAVIATIFLPLHQPRLGGRTGAISGASDHG